MFRDATIGLPRVPTSKPPRACIYARTSTTEQRTENQLPELLDVARRRGFHVVETHEEQGSAFKERPKFKAMMAAAHRGEIDVIVVWSIDRFGRSMVGNLQASLDLGRWGVRIVSAKESWLDTSGPMLRDLLVGVFSWVAAQEASRLRERTVAGLESAKKRGVHLEHRMGFRTEDFKGFSGVARSDDDECLCISRRGGRREHAKSRRKPTGANLFGALGRPPARIDMRHAKLLRDEGLSVREVARRLKCSPSSLHRALRGHAASQIRVGAIDGSSA